MIGFIVAGIEIGLAVLLVFMAYKMVALARSRPFQSDSVSVLSCRDESMTRTESHASDATRAAYQRAAIQFAAPTPHTADLITQLHIFASIQATDLRRHDLHLRNAAHPLKLMAAAYLYGATCALAFGTGREPEQIMVTAIKVIQHTLEMGEVSVEQALSSLTDSGSMLYCYRNGLEGAEHWMQHRFVPENQSLYAALTANALI